jgi:hypothetical protein
MKLNNLTQRDIVYWLSDITREKIIVDKHSRKRARLRCYSEEILYEFLIERRFKRIERKVTDGVVKFEIYYDHPDKSMKKDIKIIIMPMNHHEKTIRVVTVIIK